MFLSFVSLCLCNRGSSVLILFNDSVSPVLKLFSKLTLTAQKSIPEETLRSKADKINITGEKLNKQIGNLFHGSLAIRQVDAGSDNACEQEITALSNPYYDVSRFGIHFVASPRHADMLMVTGPVTRNMAEALRRTYEAVPHPKLVVAVGDDAIDEKGASLFYDSYAVVGAVSKVIPIDYAIPGDPPSPEEILSHLLAFLDALSCNQERS